MFFKCPICGCREVDVVMDDLFSVGDVVECPDCLNLLLVQSNYSLVDFKDILADQVNNNKRKAQSKLNEVDAITVRYL